MKDFVFGLLGWIGIIGVPILICSSCDRVHKAQVAENREHADAEFAEFCKTNNAAPALEGEPGGNLLTIDLQRSLFVNEKRVACKAILRDLWRSKKDGTMVARFHVDYGRNDIDAYLKCTEPQASALHDQYQKNFKTTFLIAAEFERVDAFPASDPKSESEETYRPIGVLIASQVAKKAVK